MLSFFSSSNGVVNTKRAVAECLENALGAGDTDCDLIVFHTGVGHDFGELLSGLRRAAPSARILGCTGTGVIGKEGPNENPRALAVMAARGAPGEIAVAGLESIAGLDPKEAGLRIAKQLHEQAPGINMVLLFPAILDMFPIEEAIAGIESVLGADVKICGGIANQTNTSPDALRGAFEFFDDQALQRAAVAVGFADPSLEVVAHATHGHSPFGKALIVTKSHDNRVVELDGKPAWRAFLDALGLPETTDSASPALVPLWAIAHRLPEALHADYGSGYSLYIGSALREEDGSMYTAYSSPPGTELWATERSEKQVFDGVDTIVGKIVAEAKGRAPVAVFHADCAARGKFLFNRFLKEEIVARMQVPLCNGQDVPWLGFYSGGEFCPLAGRNWFHGFTTSLFALYRK